MNDYGSILTTILVALIIITAFGILKSMYKNIPKPNNDLQEYRKEITKTTKI